EALRGQGRLGGVGGVTVGVDLDVVAAGREHQRVGERARLEVGDRLLAVDVDVDGQARDAVQDRDGRLVVVGGGGGGEEGGGQAARQDGGGGLAHESCSSCLGWNLSDPHPALRRCDPD